MKKIVRKILHRPRLIYRYQKAKAIYNKYKDFTMIEPEVFIDNLLLVGYVANLEGAVVECGVWRGGMIAGIYDFLKVKRKCYLFDSFEGLPEVKENDGNAAKKWQEMNSNGAGLDNCKAEMEYVEKAMQLAKSSKHKIIKGWFDKTIPETKIDEPIAVLRLDADWYDSTMICLENLYPLLIENGLIIIDDYYAWDGCSRAVHDYLSKNNLPLRISQTKNGVCYIINSKKGRTI